MHSFLSVEGYQFLKFCPRIWIIISESMACIKMWKYHQLLLIRFFAMRGKIYDNIPCPLMYYKIHSLSIFWKFRTLNSECWIYTFKKKEAAEIPLISIISFYPTSMVAQLVKNPPAMQETLVWFLDWEDPLEKKSATHSSMHGLPWWLRW